VFPNPDGFVFSWTSTTPCLKTPHTSPSRSGTTHAVYTTNQRRTSNQQERQHDHTCFLCTIRFLRGRRMPE
jgi:hypothetical protein